MATSSPLVAGSAGVATRFSTGISEGLIALSSLSMGAAMATAMQIVIKMAMQKDRILEKSEC